MPARVCSNNGEAAVDGARQFAEMIARETKDAHDPAQICVIKGGFDEWKIRYPFLVVPVSEQG